MFGFFKDYKESGKLDGITTTLGQFFMMFIQTLGIVIGMFAAVFAIIGLIFSVLAGIVWIIDNAGPIIGSIVGVVVFAFILTVWGWFSGYRP